MVSLEKYAIGNQVWSTEYADGDVLISTEEQIDTCISDKGSGEMGKKEYVGVI